METKAIKILELLREIRDEHYLILKNRTNGEIKEYFRSAAEKAEKIREKTVPEQLH